MEILFNPLSMIITRGRSEVLFLLLVRDHLCLENCVRLGGLTTTVMSMGFFFLGIRLFLLSLIVSMLLTCTIVLGNELALEKVRVVKDAYFMLATTLFGIVVTDA